MADSEIFRPNTAVNAAWATSAVANVDDVVTAPAVGDGSIVQATAGDEGETQIYACPASAGGDYTHATLLQLSIYARHVGGGSLQSRVNPTGETGDWTSFQPIALTSSFAWYSLTWALPQKPLRTKLLPQIGLLAHGIGTSVDVDAAYLTAHGVSLTTPTNAMSVPQERVVAALAQMQAFRSWTLSTSEAEARGRIYYDQAQPGDLVGAMPLAIVKQLQAPAWEKVSGGSQNFLRPAGGVALVLYGIDEVPGDVGASQQAFAEFIGDVCQGLAEIAGADVDGVPQLLITSIQPSADVQRTKRETDAAQGQGYWSGDILVQWGDS